MNCKRAVNINRWYDYCVLFGCAYSQRDDLNFSVLA